MDVSAATPPLPFLSFFHFLVVAASKASPASSGEVFSCCQVRSEPSTRPAPLATTSTRCSTVPSSSLKSTRAVWFADSDTVEVTTAYGSVTVSYRTEADPSTWHYLGAADSFGRTVLPINTINGIYRGLRTTRIELMLTLTDTSGSTPLTETPIVESVVVKFIKLAQSGAAWLVHVPLSDYDLWRDFPYEYAFGKLPIDVINGSPLLREWIDDACAEADDLERLVRPDEDAWLDESVAEFLTALFISEHTAANHIRSILRKTSCANRTEAASYAHRHGLVSE